MRTTHRTGTHRTGTHRTGTHRTGGLLLAALLLASCASDPQEAASPDADAPTTVAPTTRPTSGSQPGPTTLVAAEPGNLVAVDTATGETTVLLNNLELAESLGFPFGTIQGADLSPDGRTVAVAFQATEDDRSVGALYEVPVDGATPPTRIPLASDDSFVSGPRWSPDGRLLAVHHGDRLSVLDERRALVGDGIQMPYAPLHMTWSAAGDTLVWVPHHERSDCCPVSAVAVDPATGQFVGEVAEDRVDGLPYFDDAGLLQGMPEVHRLDLDATGGFAVALDASSGQVVWWALDDEERRPFAFDLLLEDEPTVVTW